MVIVIFWMCGCVSAQVLWAPGGVTVCGLSGPQESPSLIADGAGGAIIAWADRRDMTVYDIYAQHVDADGESLWTTGGAPVCTVSQDQYFPSITATQGGYIIAWQDVRNISGQSDIYAQKLNSDGIPQWTSGGVAVCNNFGNQYAVAVASDNTGGAYVAWRDTRNDPLSGNTDIYLQRIGSDGLNLWANAVHISKPGVEDRDVSLTSDGAGGVILVWQDGRGALSNPSTGKDIYAQRVGPNGTLMWGADALPICTAPGDQRFPRMIPDGAGGIIITWDDRRNGTTYGVYAQRISASGAPYWTANGVAVCALPDSNQVVPAISPDGSGGAFIAWTDAREGSSSRYFDIYAQRITENGTLAWNSLGVVVCSAPGWQGRIRSAEAAAGYVFLSWADNRRDPTNQTYDYDIYAQKLDASGTPQWAQDGILASNDQTKQEMHQMVSVGSNAIIVWQDNQVETGKDIFAQKIGSDEPDIISVQSISEGKNISDGNWISVDDKIVSAVFESSFYMQEPDRSSGIRVYATGVSEGDMVTVLGRLETVNGERVLLDAVVTQP